MNKEPSKIKTEPPEFSDEQRVRHHVMDIKYKLAHSEHLLNLTFPGLEESNGRYVKPTSSPAQEAAKARIRVCEMHLRALFKKQADPDQEENDLEKIRKVEEDLRKAHARLKRLTNEAQRQRRRRERLRMGLTASSPSVLGVSKELKFFPNENSVPSVSAPSSTELLSMPRAKDRAIMGVLRKCGNFKDLARELLSQGFMLRQTAGLRGTGQVESTTSPEENNQEIEVEDNPAAVLEQSMSFEEDENNNINDQEIASSQPDVLEIKSELALEDISGVDDNNQDRTTENNAANIKFSVPNIQVLTNEDSTPSTRSDPRQAQQQNVTDMVRIFAETYAMRHTSQIREWQDQYQLWFQRQLESQQQWQEVFMREQIERTRSMVENVTTTFLQEMQQILQNVITSVSHRPMVPFIPNISRNSECLFSVIPTSSQTI